MTRYWYRGALAVEVTAFGLLGWLLYGALGLASAQVAVAVAATGLAGVLLIASSVPMWNQILRYARGEPIAADRPGAARRPALMAGDGVRYVPSPRSPPLRARMRGPVVAVP